MDALLSLSDIYAAYGEGQQSAEMLERCLFALEGKALHSSTFQIPQLEHFMRSLLSLKPQYLTQIAPQKVLQVELKSGLV